MKRVPVLVAMRGRRVPTLANRLARRARALLRVLRIDGAELSLALVSDPVMHGLNKTWRGKDRPTDVLSFAMLEAAGPWGARPRAIVGERRSRPSGARYRAQPERLLGDVVISVDTARRQAAEYGHSLEAEVDRLLVHGVLHLIGYDHERSAAEARRMFRKERVLLRGLGTAR
jgi:probable rRNA maturation factor